MKKLISAEVESLPQGKGEGRVLYKCPISQPAVPTALGQGLLLSLNQGSLTAIWPGPCSQQDRLVHRDLGAG